MKHCPSRCRRWPAWESDLFLRRTLADGLANQVSPAPWASARGKFRGAGGAGAGRNGGGLAGKRTPHHALAARFLDRTAARLPAHAIAPPPRAQG